MASERKESDGSGIFQETRIILWVKKGWKNRLVRSLCGAFFWQLLGKLLQVVGVAYAARCLGAANLGLSGTVMVVAAQVQFLLDFGLDIVAVRHAAAKTARLPDIISAIFTLRTIISVATAGIWLIAVFLSPVPSSTKGVWALGAAYFVVLVLNFSWYYQATEQMARFSLIQMLTSLGVSICFLLLFHPNQAAGSDLLVMVLLNAMAGAGVWWGIRRASQARLLSLKALSAARDLMIEGRPNWVFNLSYYALASMSQPLIYALLGDEPSGLFRSAFVLVTSAQMFLSYFSLAIYPRIVVWRNERVGEFRRRIFQVAGGLCGCGLVAFSLLKPLHRPVFQFIYGAEFVAASPLLPILLMAKFIAAGSGVLVWGMFANQKDWLAAKCCFWPALLELGLCLMILPRYVAAPLNGIAAAAWLNCLTEILLFAFCAVCFARMKVQPASRA